MYNILLIQLPIPQTNFLRQTGNIPLGLAKISQFLSSIPNVNVEIMPESLVSYIADQAILEYIKNYKPDHLGFSCYCWNIERVNWLVNEIKKCLPLIKITLGGPEITYTDLSVNDSGYQTIAGEGELLFRYHISNLSGRMPLDNCLDYLNVYPSPYLDDLIEYQIENIMLLETQRGCPYKCGFCNYNKQIKQIQRISDKRIMEGIQWAYDNQINEVYLLDPSLNSRPFLGKFLHKIIAINQNQKLKFVSEIRAEMIDEKWASLMKQANFTEFEIGLQTTNPKALSLMNRHLNLSKFTNSIRILQKYDIKPKVDIIIGLPGDNLTNFKKTVDYCVQENLSSSIQVFPLSILPGTEFKDKSDQLFLNYQASPPYLITNTDQFSENDIFAAFQYAEKAFNIEFNITPDFSFSHPVYGKFVRQVFLKNYQSLQEIISLGKCLTQPYQIILEQSDNNDPLLLEKVNILTSNNPYTPLEIVFLNYFNKSMMYKINNNIAIKRPSFLDNDLRYQKFEEGNRTVNWFVLTEKYLRISSELPVRQILWWKKSRLPFKKELYQMDEFQGILIDLKPDKINDSWLLDLAIHSENLLPVSFKDDSIQVKWWNLTKLNEYWAKE